MRRIRRKIERRDSAVGPLLLSRNSANSSTTKGTSDWSEPIGDSPSRQEGQALHAEPTGKPVFLALCSGLPNRFRISKRRSWSDRLRRPVRRHGLRAPVPAIDLGSARDHLCEEAASLWPPAAFDRHVRFAVWATKEEHRSKTICAVHFNVIWRGHRRGRGRCAAGWRRKRQRAAAR